MTALRRGLIAAVVGLALAAPAASAKSFFTYCNRSHLGFGMKLNIVPGGKGHLVTRISYYITGLKRAKDSSIVFFSKGPSLFHHDKSGYVFAMFGEQVAGDVTNADSDGRWHPLDMRKLSSNPLPIGTFPYPSSHYWKLWLHYIVDIWPHGKGNGGCWFQLTMYGPTNAYFP